MTSAEYLQELHLRLSHRLTGPELERLMRYYEDYFKEAGPAGEQRVIEELGSPERLVRRIMGEQPVEGLEPPRTGMRPLWIVVLAVCAAPVVIPLAFSLVVLVLALAFSGLVCVAYGGAASFVGFTSVLTHGIPTAIFFMGGGAVTAGIGLLLAAAAFGLCGLCCRGIRWLLGRGRQRGEAYAS